MDKLQEMITYFLKGKKKKKFSEKYPRKDTLYIRNPTWPDMGSTPVTSSHMPEGKHNNHNTTPCVHHENIYME